jgi:hypothetical protein
MHGCFEEKTAQKASWWHKPGQQAGRSLQQETGRSLSGMRTKRAKRGRSLRQALEAMRRVSCGQAPSGRGQRGDAVIKQPIAQYWYWYSTGTVLVLLGVQYWC